MQSVSNFALLLIAFNDINMETDDKKIQNKIKQSEEEFTGQFQKNGFAHLNDSMLYLKNDVESVWHIAKLCDTY